MSGPVGTNQLVSVTLKAGEWLWLLGLLTSISNQGENRTLDKLYDQIVEATGMQKG